MQNWWLTGSVWWTESRTPRRGRRSREAESKPARDVGIEGERWVLRTLIIMASSSRQAQKEHREELLTLALRFLVTFRLKQDFKRLRGKTGLSG